MKGIFESIGVDTGIQTSTVTPNTHNTGTYNTQGIKISDPSKAAKGQILISNKRKYMRKKHLAMDFQQICTD